MPNDLSDQAKAAILTSEAQFLANAGRTDEALSCAYAARRLEQNSALDFGPKEERPTELASRLERLSAEQREARVQLRRSNGRTLLMSNTLAESYDRGVARQNDPKNSKSEVELLPPPPQRNAGFDTPQIAAAKSPNSGAPSIVTRSVDPAGASSTAANRVARVSANQGNVEIRSAFQTAPGREVPVTSVAPMRSVATVQGATGGGSPHSFSVPPAASAVAMLPPGANETHSLAAPPRAAAVPTPPTAMAGGDHSSPGPLLAAAQPAQVVAGPLSQAAALPAPPADLPVLTSPPPAAAPSIPPVSQPPAGAVFVAAAPSSAEVGPSLMVVPSAVAGASPPLATGSPDAAGPAAASVEPGAETSPIRRIADQNHADKISLASLIGFVIGIIGLCGLGVWRRMERQHYRVHTEA